MATLGAALAAGCSIGVHKRVDTPGTAAYQETREVHSLEQFVTATRRVISGSVRQVTHIFLATDDALAETTFREVFASKK